MKSKYQDDTKMFDMYAKNRYSCKCGHRILILNKDKKFVHGVEDMCIKIKNKNSKIN